MLYIFKKYQLDQSILSSITMLLNLTNASYVQITRKREYSETNYKLICKIRSLHDSINKNYLPIFEKYVYHCHHFVLLEKNETTDNRNKNLRLGHIVTTRDYEDCFYLN